jgi:hypothetical protein
MSCLSLAHVELSLCCPPLIHTLSTGYPSFRGRSRRLSRRALPRLSPRICHMRLVAPQRCKLRCICWHRHAHVHSIAGSQTSCVSLLLNDVQRHPLTAYTRYAQRDLEGKKGTRTSAFLRLQRRMDICFSILSSRLRIPSGCHSSVSSISPIRSIRPLTTPGPSTLRAPV